MNFEENISDVLIRILDKYGFKAKALRRSSMRVSPATLRPAGGAEIVVDVLAIFYDPQTQGESGGWETDLQSEFRKERKYLIVKTTVPGTSVESGDFIQPLDKDGNPEGDELRVDGINPIRIKGGDPIYYRISSEI